MILSMKIVSFRSKYGIPQIKLSHVNHSFIYQNQFCVLYSHMQLIIILST